MLNTLDILNHKCYRIKCQRSKPPACKDIGGYIDKVVKSVCLLITHEPIDHFVSNFNWGTRENRGNLLSLSFRF